MAIGVTATSVWQGVRAMLTPYAQIVFSRDPRVGVLVLLAIATFPKLALASLGAVSVAAFVSLLFGLGVDAVKAGGVGCTAALATLALGAFDPGSGNVVVLVVLAGLFAVLYTASFEAMFTSLALPAHALPFIATAWTIHLAARVMPAAGVGLGLLEPWSAIPVDLFATSWLDIPAALVFVHGSVAGLLLVLAIGFHSRIALILAGIGAGVAWGMHAALRGEAGWTMLDTIASFNAVLAAVAIGGVWFVPQPTSMLLAAGGALVASALAYALVPATGLFSLPALSLPFVMTTLLVLAAARRRLHDRYPRSTVPDDRPEEALARHLMWIRRFGDAAWLPFRLPFRGQWVVTQGHDGAHTHKGPWRHGLDFETRTPQGGVHQGDGASLRDYACYGLPVVAAGSGTVASVTDGIKDNAPGEVNLHDNWGNVVVIAHGAGLYSVYAHLQLRSIRVKTGDVVTAGAEIARCGSSGRSPIPHLHFQVQQAATLGSPTIPVDFGDVVTRGDDGLRLDNRVIPVEGQMVRAVVRDEAIARALAFTPETVFELRDEEAGLVERLRVQVDLMGRRYLESARAKLFMDPYESALVFLDFQGSPSSLMRYLFLSLARVPFDQSAPLAWGDSISKRFLLPGWLRAAADLLSVFVPTFGNIPVAYRTERAEGELVVHGEAVEWSTIARISLGDGVHRFEIKQGKKTRRLTLRREAPAAEGGKS